LNGFNGCITSSYLEPRAYRFFIHSKHCIVVVNAYFKLPFEWFAAQSFARFADAVNFYLVTVKFKVIDDMVFNSFYVN